MLKVKPATTKAPPKEMQRAPEPETKEEAPAAAAPNTEKAVTVRKKRSSEVATAVPVSRMRQLANFGLEKVTHRDYSTPFLKLLQKLSGEVDDVDNAEAGMFYLTSNGELWDGVEGVELIPCGYLRTYIEYLSDRGGFVKVHEPDSGIERTAKREGRFDVLPTGNTIEDTACWFCLVKTADGWERAQINLRGTSIKQSRKWLTLIGSQRMTDGDDTFCPPMFANVYTLTAQEETKDRNTWYLPVAGSPKPADEPGLFDQAFAFAQQFVDGEVKPGGEPAAERTEKPIKSAPAQAKQDADDEETF